MLGSHRLRCFWPVALLVLVVSASALAGSVTFTTPKNLALFQQNNGVANIPVSAVAKGVPPGGGVWFVLDGDTPQQVSAAKLKLPYTYTFRNVKLGEHTLDVYMIDSKGNLLGPSDTLSRVGVGELIVCVGDSITAGEDDTFTVTSADGRNGPHVDPDDGLAWSGYEPVLNNLLTAANGYPCSVINEGYGGETSAGGVKRLPSIIAQYPTANTWIIGYGTNDINTNVSTSVFETNLATMINQVETANPNSFVYMPKILYGGQSNIGAYLDVMGTYIYYNSGNVAWGADMYTMWQTNYATYNRMTAQPGTWYAVDTVCHPNGPGYQEAAMLWELAIEKNAFIVADGTASTVGRPTADIIQLTGVNDIGLSANNLLLVCNDLPAQPVPTGTTYPSGGWSTFLTLTGATDFTGGSLTATVQLSPWELSNSGVASWSDYWLSSNSTILTTTRSAVAITSTVEGEDLTATVSHVGQLVPVVEP